MDVDDQFLNEVLSLTRNRVRRATLSANLKQQLLERLDTDSKRFVQRLQRRQPPPTIDSFEGLDMVAIDSGMKVGALVAANTNGGEAFAAYALFGFLLMKSKHRFNIYALPRAELGSKGKELPPTLLKSLRALVRGKNIKLAIVLSDGMPHFDGFYLGLTNNRTQRKAKDLLSNLRSSGFTLGKYSLREDWPAHELIESRSPLLLALNSLGASAYEFIVSDEIKAGIEALGFFLNVKSS